MKTSTAMMAMVVGLALPALVDAQLFGRPGTTNPRTVPTPAPRLSYRDATNAPSDSKVLPANAVIPEPVNPDKLSLPAIPLPPEPIDGYLLTKQNGPFMVLAYTFQGEYADKYAQALAIELRVKHGLPAYVLRTKDFPGKSMIRNVPPTAPTGVFQPQVGLPEKLRTLDEAAVLVGDEKTLDDSEKLLHRVKKIRPICVDAIPNKWTHRKGDGLKRAIRTTNPYIPAEDLFVRKPDVMLKQINQGPHSIFNCPGKYSLQVAEFSGLSDVVNPTTREGMFNMFNLKRGPLAHAADDAEKLANALARDKQVNQSGGRPYVFHSRYSSKVMMGSFDSPNDPSAIKLRRDLLLMGVDLNNRGVTDVMIVPATSLTEVARITRGDDITTVTTSESAPPLQSRYIKR